VREVTLSHRDRARKTRDGCNVERLSASRRWVGAASAINREQNTIHLVAEADITVPRLLIAQHRERTGERLSLTAYIATCLAQTLKAFPRFNAFRKGRRLVFLHDITINVLFERDIGGESVPEPIGIHAAGAKTYRQIHDTLRMHQQQSPSHVGDASGLRWLGLLPAFLFKIFVRLAARSIAMNRRYGVVGLTSIGMFGRGAMWPVPLTHATVSVAVGSIVLRPVMTEGRIEEREHLCLTVSFNHDLIDGAPAARFTAHFIDALTRADGLRDIVQEGHNEVNVSGPKGGMKEEEA
jgi:hypothetical protein